MDSRIGKGSSHGFKSLKAQFYTDHTKRGPPPVANGVQTAPIKWMTGIITLLIGVIAPFVTGRGPTLALYTLRETNVAAENRPSLPPKKPFWRVDFPF